MGEGDEMGIKTGREDRKEKSLKINILFINSISLAPLKMYMYIHMQPNRKEIHGHPKFLNYWFGSFIHNLSFVHPLNI